MLDIIFEQKENIASTIIRNYQHVLIPVARFCLLGFFIDDGFRVALQWKHQHRYISAAWASSSDWSPANALITFSIIGQIIPSVIILFVRQRCAIIASCITLIFMLVYHTILYNNHLSLRFLAINFAIIGGLFLLISEAQDDGEKQHHSAGGGLLQREQLKSKMSKSLLLLAGRILLPCMFLSLVRWDPANPLKMVELAVATVPMLFIVVGFKTRPCAVSMAFWLAFVNLSANAWWQLPLNHPYREYSKFDFFQTLSVIGGLLLVCFQGPGRFSLDEYNKKNW